jgi:hypothetical protein
MCSWYLDQFLHLLSLKSNKEIFELTERNAVIALEVSTYKNTKYLFTCVPITYIYLNVLMGLFILE